jgi:hypothetical protein
VHQACFINLAFVVLGFFGPFSFKVLPIQPYPIGCCRRDFDVAVPVDNAVSFCLLLPARIPVMIVNHNWNQTFGMLAVTYMAVMHNFLDIYNNSVYIESVFNNKR